MLMEAPEEVDGVRGIGPQERGDGLGGDRAIAVVDVGNGERRLSRGLAEDALHRLVPYVAGGCP